MVSRNQEIGFIICMKKFLLRSFQGGQGSGGTGVVLPHSTFGILWRSRTFSLYNLFLDFQIVHDVLAAVGGVAAHVEGDGFGEGVVVGDVDGGEADGVGDEAFEFAGGDFAEAFETGDFGGGAEFFDGGFAFVVGVAVEGFFFVADAEEGGFEDEEVAVFHNFFVEAEEERNHQIADVEAVNVGVGGEDDFVVAEGFGTFFDVEGANEIVDFDVFVDGVAFEVADVEGFSAEGEDALRGDVAATGDGTGGGKTFGDEEHGVEAGVFLRVEVLLAIFELRDADGDGFGAFAGEFFNGVELGAKGAGFFDFGDELVGFGGFAVEELFDDALDFGDEFAADFLVAEFVFGLRFEDGGFEADGNGADEAVADVVGVVLFLFTVFVDGFKNTLFEGGKMCAAVVCVLAVDEGEVVFAETVGVREGEFERAAAVVKRLVDFFEFGLVFDEVEKAVFRFELHAVEAQDKAGVEVRVHAHAAFDVFGAEFVFEENRCVRCELHKRAVSLVCFARGFFHQLATRKTRFGKLPVAVRPHQKVCGQRVDRLCAHAVQAH